MSVSGISKRWFVSGILLLSLALTIQAQVKTFRFKGMDSNEMARTQRPSCAIREQSAEMLKMDYAFSGFSIFDMQGGADQKNYHVVRIDGYGLSMEVGSPALPARTEKIIIPAGKAAKISIVSKAYTDYTDIDIFPAQEMPSDGGKAIVGFSKDELAYQRNSFAPEQLAELVGEQTFRGVNLGFLRISPVQYNPATHTIRVHQEFTVHIEFIESNEKTFIPSRFSKASDFQILQNTVLNSELLPSADPFEKTAYTLQPKGYLIVTVPQFEAAVDSLAKWKRQLGYHVEIYSQSNWTISQVKSLTTNVYNNSSYDFEYLLIFGDQQHVPDYYYSEDINGDPWEIYSTNYYACMDGNNDFVPEMAHGRITVRDADQALLVVDKIIKYEKSPPTDPNFYTKGIHAGYFQDSLRDGTSDYRYCKTTLDIYDYMTARGFNSDLILYAEPGADPRRFNAYFTGQTTLPSQYLRSNGYKWDGDKDDILAAWNQGRLYAFHRDHGLIDQWMAPYFHIDHMDQLTNGDKLPIVFSVNCGTGMFVNPEPYVCFSEKLLRHPNGGAVGIVSATAATKSGFNDGLIIGMMDAIWSSPGFIPDMGMGADNVPITPHGPIYAMGDVLIQGLLRMTETWSENGWADKNQYHLYHYFGDPAMKIWTALPIQLTANHATNLTTGAQSLYLAGVNAQDALATVMVGDEIIKSVSISNGQGTISFPQPLDASVEEVILTVSQHNYIPYIAKIKLSKAPETDFEASAEEICNNSTISFTDLSTGNPNHWIWTIEPSGFEFVESSQYSQNPTVRFLNPDRYTISLTAQNDYGSETITREDYILVKPIPAAPEVSGATRCYDAEMPTLHSTGEAVKWYSDEELSSLISQGTEYTPGDAPVGSISFYLTQSLNGCVSEAAEVSLLTYPETTLPMASGTIICEFDTALVMARGTKLTWYSDSLRTETLAEGDTLRQFPLEAGTHVYFVSNTENDCESEIVPCTALIKPQPPAPVAENVEVCFGENIIIGAEGEHIYWYENSDKLSPLYYGNNYEAGILFFGKHTYYMTQEIDGCTSEIGEVAVFVNSLPVFTLGKDTSIYYSDTLEISCDIDGTYTWFNGSESRSLNFVGSEYGLGEHLCWLEVQSVEHCFSSDSIIINVERTPEEVNYFQFDGTVFSIYPNPSSGVLNLKFFQSIDKPTRLILTDTKGRIAMVEELDEVDSASIIEMDLSSIKEGLYLLTITNEKIVHTLRIIKE